MGTLANSEGLDEMQQDATFHQGLHCLLIFKQHSETEIYHNLENSTCISSWSTLLANIKTTFRDRNIS